MTFIETGNSLALAYGMRQIQDLGSKWRESAQQPRSLSARLSSALFDRISWS